MLKKISEAEPLPGWKLKRVDEPPFHQIEMVAPNGYAAVAGSHERNPVNILYMLADAVLKEAAARDLAAEFVSDPANDPIGSGPFWNAPKPEPDGYLYHFRKIGGGRRYTIGSIPYDNEWDHPRPDDGFEYAGKTAMYVRPETVDEAFERGRQQGMKQEHALWELAASSQEIAAGEAAARDEGATVDDSQRCIDARNRLWEVLDGPGSVIGCLEEAVETACSHIEYARPRLRQLDLMGALSNADLRLMAGELTANEIRAVRAVLRGLKRRAVADLKSATPPPSTREADADEYAHETGAISMSTGEPIDPKRFTPPETMPPAPAPPAVTGAAVARDETNPTQGPASGGFPTTPIPAEESDEEFARQIEAFDRNLPEGFVLVPTIPTPAILAALRADTTASLRWANALRATQITDDDPKDGALG